MCAKNKKLSKTSELILSPLVCFDQLISVGHGDLGELNCECHSVEFRLTQHFEYSRQT